MTDSQILAQLRRNPTQWHRRGMTAPVEIDQMIADRLGQPYFTQDAVEPSYADFFTAA